VLLLLELFDLYLLRWQLVLGSEVIPTPPGS